MTGDSRNALLETVIMPRTRDLGDGFEVRRALPSAQRRMVGPFVFFDQMGPVILHAGRGLDVRPHPQSASPRSPICSTEKSCTATAWAMRNRSGPGR